jgi:hypothetical protein
LHERYGLSFNVEEMASAKSLVAGLAHLGSSYREVLPSPKRVRHFFTIERVNTFVSSTDLSSAPIVKAGIRFQGKCPRVLLFVCGRLEELLWPWLFDGFGF